MTKEIPLTRGKIALVDDEDYEYLRQWKWHSYTNHGLWYAKRSKSLSYPEIQMHRLLLDAPKNLQVDHVDGNGLNNQKRNLRLCSHGSNAKNRKTNSKTSSGYKGVIFRKSIKKYQVRIAVDGKNIHVGVYRNIDDAAKAYDTAAIKYHGEFARLNFGMEKK